MESQAGSFEVPGRCLGYPGLGLQGRDTAVTSLGPATFRAWSYPAEDADGSPSLGGPFLTSLPVPAGREPRWTGTCWWGTGTFRMPAYRWKATKSFDGDSVTDS